MKYTRAILDAIHSGELAKAEYETYETFNLHVPKTCPGVPDELLNPKKSWSGQADFKGEVTKLGGLFVENFKKYADEATEEVIKAGEDIPLVRTPLIADRSAKVLRFESALRLCNDPSGNTSRGFWSIAHNKAWVILYP